MFGKIPINGEHAAWAGGILMLLSAVYCGVALFRFDLLRGSNWARWGRGRAGSFPASKLGALSSGLFGLAMGFAMMDDHLSLLPGPVTPIVVLALFAFILGVGLRDYRWHRHVAPRRVGAVRRGPK